MAESGRIIQKPIGAIVVKLTEIVKEGKSRRNRNDISKDERRPERIKKNKHKTYPGYKLSNITTTHRAMMEMLLRGMTKEQVAAELGISVTTVRRVCSSPVFQAEFRRLQVEALNRYVVETMDVKAKLAALQPIALDTLHEIMTSEATPLSVKRAAAKDVLLVGEKYFNVERKNAEDMKIVQLIEMGFNKALERRKKQEEEKKMLTVKAEEVKEVEEVEIEEAKEAADEDEGEDAARMPESAAATAAAGNGNGDGAQIDAASASASDNEEASEDDIDGVLKMFNIDSAVLES